MIILQAGSSFLLTIHCCAMYIIYVHFSKQAIFVAVRLCFFDGTMALRDACLSWLSTPEDRFCAW